MSKRVVTWHVKSNNIPLVLSASKKQVQNGLNAIGERAATHAKRGCPVDTGRLKNSISYITETKQGAMNSGEGEKAGGDDYKAKGKPENNAVYIGTNVEYAPAQEYLDMTHEVGGPHFIKNAAANHGSEYKKDMEAALKA